MDPNTTEKYSWKFFTYDWRGATPGEHTVTSRATDVNGYRQPTAEELEVKQTFLEQKQPAPADTGHRLTRAPASTGRGAPVPPDGTDPGGVPRR